MKNHVWKIGFFTGLILTLGSINKAVIVRSESVDTLAQSQNIARSAQLTASQLKRLVSVDRKKFKVKLNNDEFEDRELRVIVPTYIPPGFKVDKLEVKDNDSEKSYKIFYRNSNNSCFYIKNTIKKNDWESFGGFKPFSKTIVEVNSPLIGKAYISTYRYQRESNNSPIFLQILEYSQSVGFGSPCSNNGKTINIQEAVKIVESLQYLNP